MQIGITDDERYMSFTEHGLAEALAGSLGAVEGGDEEENAERAQELAANIFLAATMEKRGLGHGEEAE